MTASALDIRSQPVSWQVLFLQPSRVQLPPSGAYWPYASLSGFSAAPLSLAKSGRRGSLTKISWDRQMPLRQVSEMQEEASRIF